MLAGFSAFLLPFPPPEAYSLDVSHVVCSFLYTAASGESLLWRRLEGISPVTLCASAVRPRHLMLCHLCLPAAEPIFFLHRHVSPLARGQPLEAGTPPPPPFFKSILKPALYLSEQRERTFFSSLCGRS